MNLLWKLLLDYRTQKRPPCPGEAHEIVSLLVHCLQGSCFLSKTECLPQLGNLALFWLKRFSKVHLGKGKVSSNQF